MESHLGLFIVKIAPSQGCKGHEMENMQQNKCAYSNFKFVAECRKHVFLASDIGRFLWSN